MSGGGRGANHLSHLQRHLLHNQCYRKEKLNLPKALVIKHCTTWGIFIFSHFDSVHFSQTPSIFLNHLISSLSLIFSKRKERDLLDTWGSKYITEISRCMWVNFNVQSYGRPSGNWKVQRWTMRCSKTENLLPYQGQRQSITVIYSFLFRLFPCILLVLPAGVCVVMRHTHQVKWLVDELTYSSTENDLTTILMFNQFINQ